jgi:hypothetical protein
VLQIGADWHQPGEEWRQLGKIHLNLSSSLQAGGALAGVRLHDHNGAWRRRLCMERYLKIATSWYGEA